MAMDTELEIQHLQVRVKYLEATIIKLQIEFQQQFQILHDRCFSHQTENSQSCFQEGPIIKLSTLVTNNSTVAPPPRASGFQSEEAGDEEDKISPGSGPAPADSFSIKSELIIGTSWSGPSSSSSQYQSFTNPVSPTDSDAEQEQSKSESDDQQQSPRSSSMIHAPVIKMETDSVEWATEDLDEDDEAEDMSSFYFDPNNSQSLMPVAVSMNPTEPGHQEFYQYPPNRTEIKVFPCDQCGKCFDERGKLNTHKQIHTDVKNFECETCQKRFKTKGNLRSHVFQVHRLGKLFNCTSCDKEFKNKKNLEYHIRSSHTKERPYPCNYCSYRSAEKSYIRKHVLRRHKAHFASFNELQQ